VKVGRGWMVSAVAVAVLSTAAASSGSRGTSSPRGLPPAPLSPDARYDSLAARLQLLEVRLGVRARPAGPTNVEFAARYAALRAREEEVARRAEAFLRYVPSIAPVAGVITSAFSPSRYHPIKHMNLRHVGLDIGAPFGTSVHVAADGEVFATVDHPTYGLAVDVRHGESKYMTRYAHLSRIAVRPGTRVRRGDVIGLVGSTGLSTGPHLHYEVFFRGLRKDPIHFLPQGQAAQAELLGAD
jgi:murein DD-endopeptidase MepM/ murein hydrolase activator NlpD